MRSIYAGLVVVTCTVLVPTHALAAGHTTDDLPTVKRNFEEGKAILVDIREKSEWDRGHIKDAVFLPLSELRKMPPEELAKKLPKGKPIYCHCASGVRTLQAAPLLEKHNYDAKPLKPGYRDLIAAGFQKAE